MIESYGSWTLCMWTSVRSIFLSSIAVFLSVFPCYVTQFFSASDPWPSRFHLLSVLLMCFAFLLLFPLLSFVSLIFVIVHVQASLTQWICLKKKKKKDFSCWSHAKHFELPLKYGRCFLNALYSFCCKIIKKEKIKKTGKRLLVSSFEKVGMLSAAPKLKNKNNQQ